MIVIHRKQNNKNERRKADIEKKWHIVWHAIVKWRA